MTSKSRLSTNRLLGLKTTTLSTILTSKIDLIILFLPDKHLEVTWV